MNNHADRQSQNSQIFSLNFIMTAIFKRKKIIAAFFVAVVGIVTVVNYFAPHIYESTAKLILEQDQDVEQAMIIGLQSRVNIQDFTWLNSELAIMKSYPVAERVVQSLNLYRDTSEGADTAAFDLRSAIDVFQANLTVQVGSESNVVAVSFTNEDPHVATKVVNKVIETYRNYRDELYSEADTYKFIEDQMRIADEKLRDMERSLADYKQQEGIISPEAQQAILTSRVTEYERKKTEARGERISLEVKLRQIKSQMDDDPSDLTLPNMPNTTLQTGSVSRLKEELVTMEIQRNQMLQEFTPQYQGVINLENQIASARQQIYDEVLRIIQTEESALDAIRAEEAEFERLISQTRNEISKLAQTVFEMEQRSRGVQDSRDIYSVLLKQREEARISLAKFQNGVRIKPVSPAIVPVLPIGPNKRANVAMAIFFGLIGGIGLALAIEFFDTSIDTPDDLEELGGLTVLGAVRDLDDEDTRKDGQRIKPSKVS